MRSKLAISTLVVASLFGATAIASAQTDPAQPAPGASAEGGAGAGAKMARHNRVPHHKTRVSHMRSGTTTGMAATPGGIDKSKPGDRSTARKPAGE